MPIRGLVRMDGRNLLEMKRYWEIIRTCGGSKFKTKKDGKTLSKYRLHIGIHSNSSDMNCRIVVLLCKYILELLKVGKKADKGQSSTENLGSFDSFRRIQRKCWHIVVIDDDVSVEVACSSFQTVLANTSFEWLQWTT